jgi:hypothetical protein
MLEIILLNNLRLRIIIEKIITRYHLWKFIPLKKNYYKDINEIFNNIDYVINFINCDVPEITWIQQVLPSNKFIKNNSTITGKNIMFICNNENQIKDVIDQFFNKNKNLIYLFHLSDEANIHDISLYKFFSKIIRNHFSISTILKNVYIYPLGPYKFSNLRNKSLKTKKYLFNFIGDVEKSDRKKVINQIAHLTNGFIYTYKGWKSKNMLDYEVYINTLSLSKFTICPSGFVSGDSFRIWEAISVGSIPVIFKNSDTEWLINYFQLNDFVKIIDKKNLYWFLNNNIDDLNNYNHNDISLDLFLNKVNNMQNE